MKIDKWHSVGEQEARLRDQYWTVARLIMLSKDLEVFEMPLQHMNVYNTYDKLSLRKMVLIGVICMLIGTGIGLVGFVRNDRARSRKEKREQELHEYKMGLRVKDGPEL